MHLSERMKKCIHFKLDMIAVAKPLMWFQIRYTTTNQFLD